MFFAEQSDFVDRSGRRSRDYGNVRVWLEADAGDAAAWDLVGREGMAVFVGEVEEPMSLGGLFQPVDEVLARSSLAAATRSSRRG